MFKRSPVKLIIIFIITALLFACAATPPQPDTDSPEAVINPIDEVNKIENEITVARQNQIDVLSPAVFAKAENAYLKAKNKAEQESDISVVLEYTDTARTYLQNAETNAKVARAVLEEVIESRNKARIAGATKLEEDYHEVENQFLSLTQAIEKDNVGYAQKNAPDVDKAFKKVELRAIKIETIGEVKIILNQAEEDDITQYAPESFAVAKKLLNGTDTFISENRYAKKKMYKMAQHNLFMAKRALAIANQCKTIASMPPEEIAFYIEDTLELITTQLGAPDMRDQKFYTQVDNIEGSIQSLQDDNQFMADQLKLKRAEIETCQTEYNKRMSELNQEIAFLEGKTKEEQASNERLIAQKNAMEEKLETERQFNRKFIEVQNDFDANEADVYKKGNQLVIRLKGIQFPVGQAIIMPNNYLLLSKAQRAIRTFGEPSVVLEGHTDSTGTLERNKHLSQQRAESVRQYLIANQTLPAKKLIAVGYGPERPLASNSTAEGRAMNRRIDMIIVPEMQPEE
ncbi:MAG: OmpA family protein [Desulfobacteraceae bacterium]|jgi:OOP family OmpA-OmpF porin|nr:OmpA family protein [Desulfobacteraceae bacterium]